MEGLLENKVIIDMSTFQEWLKNLIGVDAGHRMFILQVADEHGWSFAKNISTRKSGEFKDEDYQKELEAHRKDEILKKKAKFSGSKQYA